MILSKEKNWLSHFLSRKKTRLKTLYAICATPRSGSNLLCDLLEQSNAMGNPKEVFNFDSVFLPLAQKYKLIDSKFNIKLSNYLNLIVRIFSTRNNVLGMKLLFDQLQPLIGVPALGNFLCNSRFIWLIRRDVISQAVSLYIADQTGEWVFLKSEKHHNEHHLNHGEIIQYNETEIKKN
jgi:trehalose 2-sulfotransferase